MNHRERQQGRKWQRQTNLEQQSKGSQQQLDLVKEERQYCHLQKEQLCKRCKKIAKNEMMYKEESHEILKGARRK